MSARIDDSINRIIQLALEDVATSTALDATPNSDDAERLADELCTLCIEFGIEFDDFILAVMGEVLDPGHTGASKKSSGPRFPQLNQFPQHRSLLLFALEFMPS